MSRKIAFTTPILVVLVALAAIRACAEEPVVVRPQGRGASAVRDGRVDHSAYGALLEKHVDGKGLVDYAAWMAADRGALERYLAAMAAVRPEDLADVKERLAYWIDVYNALTIHGMLRFYPTDSIQDHVSHTGGFHFFRDVRIEVSGLERSLDAIEHEILRPMGEPRIHFAVVCASVGCPRLRHEAYVGRRIDEQLEAQAIGFFDDAGKFRIDRETGTVYLSKILDWFGEDFGGSDRAKLDFAARYVRPEDDRAFLKRDRLSIEYLDYDWALNETGR